jgi:hypothetical protein
LWIVRDGGILPSFILGDWSMKTALAAAMLVFAAAPTMAQQTSAAAPTAPAAPELTEAEQKTLTKCQAMDPAQQAQSSKCSKVLTKAGKGDPAKERAPDTSGSEPR